MNRKIKIETSATYKVYVRQKDVENPVLIAEKVSDRRPTRKELAVEYGVKPNNIVAVIKSQKTYGMYNVPQEVLDQYKVSDAVQPAGEESEYE